MPERSSYPAGSPSWVDLNTTDPPAARDFYGQLFGWQFDPNAEFHYVTVTKNGKQVCGINDISVTEQPPAWFTYFATDDAQKLAELITANGGAIALGPMQVGSTGTILLWEDTTGAIAGAWQAGAMAGAQLVGETGAFVWNELNTRDLDGAVAFYTTTLPVSAHDMSEGDFRYQTLQVQGRDVAGMWQMSSDVPPDTPPNWAVYFGVDDTDVAVGAATALGATVTSSAKDSPYGRFAGLADPQGAAFYVIQPTPPDLGSAPN
jgi:uncharacterized protein